MKAQIIITAVMAGLLAISLPLYATAQEESTAAKSTVEEASEGVRKMKDVKRRFLKIREPAPGTQNNTSAGDSIAAPDDNGTLKYTCSGGNCSCAGAKDCVEMKDICAPKTLGCNDYGCTCAEKPDEGDGGG